MRADEATTDTASGSGREVVVGLDGSDHSLRALSWAAANTDGPIRMVVAWSTPWWGGATPLGGAPAPAPPPDSYFEESSKQLIADAKGRVGDTEVLPAYVRRGHAGQTLTEVADRAGRLLVVGSRGRGALASALLGSISAHCASHSQVPVVIVPEGEVSAAARIVVGIDGSENADAALLWAIDHAPEGATVIAVGAWAPPMSFDGALLIEVDDMEAHHRGLVADAVERARAARPGADRTIETDVHMGDPRHVLRAAGGDQIVIGARGHHGLDYLVMGSTASALVHHPLVPTVIVPAS